MIKGPTGVASARTRIVIEPLPTEELGLLTTSRQENRWKADESGTLAIYIPHDATDALFEASPSVMSAVLMGIADEYTMFSVEQPLRAETRTVKFRLENGRRENGERQVDEHRILLNPGFLEARLSVQDRGEALGRSDRRGGAIRKRLDMAQASAIRESTNL